jgi:phosphatidylglycerol:prolipoprotein diacylglycerol transferase
MHPEICSLGPFTIYSYGLTLVIAFMVCAYLAARHARKCGIDPDIIFNLCFVVFISGIIGARVFYVASNFSYYSNNILEIIMLQKGGLAWFGGLIGGVICGILYLKIKKLAVLKIADLLVPFVALAQAIGRLGCFLNGCCYGKESAFGVYSPQLDATLIPAQLYSSLLLVFIFIILRVLQDRPHRVGQIFFTYLLLYCAKRFFMEFWRGDSPAFLFQFTLFQLISVVIFLTALTGLVIIKKRKG